MTALSLSHGIVFRQVFAGYPSAWGLRRKMRRPSVLVANDVE